MLGIVVSLLLGCGPSQCLTVLLLLPNVYSNLLRSSLWPGLTTSRFDQHTELIDNSQHTEFTDNGQHTELTLKGQHTELTDDGQHTELTMAPRMTVYRRRVPEVRGMLTLGGARFGFRGGWLSGLLRVIVGLPS